jgi:HPt (histidine-containing phosphotransfer) domain-containing protein
VQEQISFEHIDQITQRDPGATRDLLHVFIRQNLLNIDEIQAQLQKENWSGLQKVAHKIKSSLALVGLTESRALAEELERTAGNDLGRTHELAEAVSAAARAAISEVTLRLKDL